MYARVPATRTHLLFIYQTCKMRPRISMRACPSDIPWFHRERFHKIAISCIFFSKIRNVRKLRARPLATAKQNKTSTKTLRGNIIIILFLLLFLFSFFFAPCVLSNSRRNEGFWAGLCTIVGRIDAFLPLCDAFMKLYYDICTTPLYRLQLRLDMARLLFAVERGSGHTKSETVIHDAETTPRMEEE